MWIFVEKASRSPTEVVCCSTEYPRRDKTSLARSCEVGDVAGKKDSLHH